MLLIRKSACLGRRLLAASLVVGLLAVAHVAMRRLAPEADGILLPVAGLLNGLGYVFIARLDRHLERPQSGHEAFDLTRGSLRVPGGDERRAAAAG